MASRKRLVRKTTPRTEESRKTKKAKSSHETTAMGKAIPDPISDVKEEQIEEEDNFTTDLEKCDGLRLISGGSFSNVYQKTQKINDKKIKYVIKKYNVGYEVFGMDEAEILKELNKSKNKNIIKLFGTNDFITYDLYLPYYPNGTLLKLIRNLKQKETKITRDQQKKIRLSLMESVYRQMRNALTTLKEKNICHADLRPANILVNMYQQNNYNFVLCDFGNSKRYDTYELNDDDLYCLGFPYIVPPFGIKKDNKIIMSEAYDIWSLGMVLWAIYYGVGNSNGIMMSEENLYPYDHQATKSEYDKHMGLVSKKLILYKQKYDTIDSNTSDEMKMYEKYLLNRFLTMLNPNGNCTLEMLPNNPLKKR